MHPRKGLAMSRSLLLLSLLAIALGGCLEPEGAAEPAAPDERVASAEESLVTDDADAAWRHRPRPRIVLVHGAFADATGWQKVIPLLERRGYPVIAVQNPLTSLADDIATTRRVLEAETAQGPVVVVGHSFGGAVITAAAADLPNVQALVYLAAFAPEENEILGALATRFGPGPLLDALVEDSAHFLTLDRAKFQGVFCADVSRTEARVMAAVQKPIHGAVLQQALTAAAWRTTPSFYLIATRDQTINPELQRFMAARMGATVEEIRSSHVPFISQPQAAVRFIERAARATR
jgi:pimeloyl-ACP methyl ester carboxylesterase